MLTQSIVSLQDMVDNLWNNYEAQMHKRLDLHDQVDAAMFAQARKDFDNVKAKAQGYVKKLEAVVANVTSK
jgi:hypothetical protein